MPETKRRRSNRYLTRSTIICHQTRRPTRTHLQIAVGGLCSQAVQTLEHSIANMSRLTAGSGSGIFKLSTKNRGACLMHRRRNRHHAIVRVSKRNRTWCLNVRNAERSQNSPFFVSYVKQPMGYHACWSNRSEGTEHRRGRLDYPRPQQVGYGW